MKISIFNTKDEAKKTGIVCRETNFNTLIDIGNTICDTAWSPFLFKESDGVKRRNNDGFDSTDLLVLDIDEGITLEEVVEQYKDRTYIIGLTRNHQKPKGEKPPCDRFRIVFPLERPIIDAEEYIKFWQSEKEKIAAVDEQCKDVARFYFPCTNIFKINEGNLTAIEINHDVQSKADDSEQPIIAERGPVTNTTSKGRLFPSTVEFLTNGSDTWHIDFLKACMDLKEQNHTLEEAKSLLQMATKNYKGFLDSTDMEQLYDVYKNRGGKYVSREFKSISNHKPSFTPPTADDLISQYHNEVHEFRTAQDKGFSFINSAFDEYFMISAGITLIGACTGRGKSTTGHNIIAHTLLTEPDKRILLISNEESLGETLSKVACILLDYDWKKSFHSNLFPEANKNIDAVVESIANHVTVVSTNENINTSDLVEVKNILVYAKSNRKYDLVIIDYLQTICIDSSSNQKRSFEVSKDFGNFIKSYAQACNIPVIVFAQLSPPSKEQIEISARIQNDKTFVNHCHTVLEVVPDFDARTTTIKCHKQRWGTMQNWAVTLDYINGKLTVMK